jgi:hypothetical protein
MTKSELLKIEHEAQLKWLNNQMAKIANDGALSFLNVDVAERAYKKMNKSLVIDDLEIEHFMAVHLSEVGIRKLVTTLRVYLKRNGTERLQVEITKSNKNLLDKLVKVSGKTKIEIINQLIENALISDFQRPEKQLEMVTL